VNRDSTYGVAVKGALERAARAAEALGVFFAETRIPVIAVRQSGEFVTANAAAVAQ
jgi:hypothetical protein